MAQRPVKRDHNDLRDLRVGLYCRVSLDQDGTEKSVNDQEAEGREWAGRVGAILDERHVYRDADRSASRFATKQRESFTRLLDDIENGELDAVWFWELSRSQRRLDVFAKLRDLCRDHSVLWVIRDRVYDPNSYADMMTAGVLSLVSENESEMISQRVERGKRSSAHAGRPAGRVPYGYKRLKNQETGAWERDVPNVFGSDGLPVEDSPAYIVREIYDRIATGDSITAIRRDLNHRGIKTAQGYQWDNFKVRYIATSPTYIGKRVYQLDSNGSRHGDRTKAVLEGVDAGWPALVDTETFWAVQRILNDPARRTTRMGPRTGQYLLTALALCDVCGGKMVRHGPKASSRIYEDRYACGQNGCCGVKLAELDTYVEKVVVRWLSDPDTAAELSHGEDNSAAATQARADAEQGRAELQRLYADAKAGTVSPTIATLNEQRLLGVIEDAERRVQEVTLPPVLVGMIGPQAQAGWDALDIPARRLVVRTVAEIRVQRTGRGRRTPVHHRVKWRWLLGDGSNADEATVHVPAVDVPAVAAPQRDRVRPAEQRTLAVLAEGGTLLQRDLGQQIGMTRAGVYHLVDRLVQRGWIDQDRTSSNSATGRRAFTLTITDAGRQALAEAADDGQ